MFDCKYREMYGYVAERVSVVSDVRLLMTTQSG